jgi:hypothetical protein
MMLLAVGCSQDHLIRWQPSQAQKQAADLAVQAADEMATVAPESHKAIAKTGQQATRTNQTYIGLPKTRVELDDPEVESTIASASADASARPDYIEGAHHAIDTGLGWTEAILGLVGSIAGTWGLTKVGGKVRDYRQRAQTTGAALRQTVDAIDEAMDELDPQANALLRQVLSKQQDAASKVAVSQAKHE